MKKIKFLTLFFLLFGAISCDQELTELTPPDQPAPPTGTPGSLNLSKYVAIGNSLTAGFQAGALFTEGQKQSLAAILHKQFTYAGGSATFNQPDINSVNGYNSSTSNPAGGIITGRLILFDPDGPGPRSAGPAASGSPERTVTCPANVTTPALPAPYNTADLPGAYTGNKATLNNFGVPGILLGQVLTPLTGGPAAGNPAFNPLYARFASNPGTSTILGDAIAAQPTFFSFFLGNNDVLGYATTGASGAIPLTSIENFTTQYNIAINSLLASLPQAKGVVGNIPDVTSIPFFFTVPWNAVPLDAGTAASLTAGLAGPYNQFLDAMVGNNIISAEERNKRRLTYVAGQNPVLISDETLTDLSPYMQGPAAALAPYARARQTTSTDLLTLSAGGVIGTCAGSPAAINGVSLPLGDQFALIPTETLEIRQRTAAFNNVIKTAADNSNNRLALADVNTAFNTFVANRGAMINGIMLTPSIAPPYAGFSEDGVHPNGRGYAFLANIFIDAINAKFGSTIPKADITKFRGTRTPISPSSTY